MKKLFGKIRLLSDISSEVVEYGVQCAGPQFRDYVDMNCGAVPEGPFESVIDPAAPQQFLSMYVQVAEKRLAFAVSKVMEINPDGLLLVCDFVRQVGQHNQPEEVAEGKVSAEKVFEILTYFVLDGMSGEVQKNFSVQSPACVQWTSTPDVHSQFWLEAGGNPESYFKLLSAFVDGFLTGSGITFSISFDHSGQRVFSLEKR